MPTKVDTDTGWGKAQSDGVYWWRLNPADTPDAVIVKGDVFYDFAESEPTAITLGEFLGPFTASDFEQLIQLRKAAKVALEWMDWWLDSELCECDGYGHVCGKTERKREADALREALAPKEEK